MDDDDTDELLTDDDRLLAALLVPCELDAVELLFDFFADESELSEDTELDTDEFIDSD